jgi:hypothetical protein
MVLPRTQQVEEVLETQISIGGLKRRAISGMWSQLGCRASYDKWGYLTLEAIDIVMEMKRLSRWTL